MASSRIARSIVGGGARGFAETRAEVASLQGDLQTLEAAYQAGAVAVDKYLSGSSILQRQIEQLASGLTEAEAAVKKYGSATAAAAAMAKQSGQHFQQSGSQGAMGMMMLAHTIDDVRYGFSAIVNNLPQLGMALGNALGMGAEAGMKFGAVAGIAGVAINTIISHWDQLFQSVGYGTDTMKGMWAGLFGETKDAAVDALDVISARIEQLEDKPIKMAVDMFELDQAREKLKELREARQAWEQMGKGRGLFEKGAGSAVSGVLGDMQHADVEKLQEDMINARAGRMDAASPAVQRTAMTEAEKRALRMDARTTYDAKTGQARVGPADPEAEARAIEAEQERRRQEAARVRQANRKKAADELGDLVARAGSGTDPAARKELADALREAKRGDIADRVEESAPARLRPGFATAKEQQEQDAIDARGRENERKYRERQKERAGATAAALEGKVGSGLLSNPGMSNEALEQATRDAMARAGLGEEKHGPTDEVARQLRDRMNEKVRKHAAARGIGAGDARADLAFEAQERAKHEGEGGARGREAERIAGSMAGGAVGRELLKDGNMPEDELRKRVEKAMEAAGFAADAIAELMPTVAKKLKEKIDRDVETRAFDRGIEGKDARKQLSKEAEKQSRADRMKDAGGPIQVMSDKAYLDKLLVAGLKDRDPTPREQLKAAEEGNKKLGDIYTVLKETKEKKGDLVATYAAGRAARR